MNLRLLLYYILFIYISFYFCIDYYLKTEGKSVTCTEYNNPCGDLDYVMKTLLNNTNGTHTVYIDTGTHSYTIISTYFSNVAFTLSPYISSSFSSSDTSSYPIILTNESSMHTVLFPFYANISSSFHYLTFLIGNSSNEYRYFIMSFFFFFSFLFKHILRL
jgi:hypothetical protein